MTAGSHHAPSPLQHRIYTLHSANRPRPDENETFSADTETACFVSTVNETDPSIIAWPGGTSMLMDFPDAEGTPFFTLILIVTFDFPLKALRALSILDTGSNESQNFEGFSEPRFRLSSWDLPRHPSRNIRYARQQPEDMRPAQPY